MNATITPDRKYRLSKSFQQFLALYKIASAERRNYLKQCWLTRRYLEWGRAIFYPFRYLAYRWYRDFVSHEPLNYPFVSMLKDTPPISQDIPPIFLDDRLSIPEQIADKAFLFKEVDWQLDGVFRLAGGAYCTVKNLDQDCADIENLHAYHRLYWAVRYARAAACGHSRAAEGLEKGLSDWFACPWERDVTVATPYTTSERIASLAETLFWIKQGNSSHLKELVVPIKQRIYLDAIHLQGNIEYRKDFNNHILNNARALYIASRVLGDLQESNDWQSLAFRIWDDYFPELVLGDGTFSEQTSFYHLQMSRTALEYVLASRQSGHAIPPEFLVRLGKMFLLSNDLMRPDGSVIRSGNSSPDHVVQDFWGLLSAAYYCGMLMEKPRHTADTLLTLYYAGVRSNAFSSSKNSRGVTLYPEGGWAFIRNSKLNVELTAHGDPRRITYHSGDSGRGTFELWWRGCILIREPGNPSYTLKSRYWYRNGTGQNVSCLNGLAPGISAEYQAHLPEWYYQCQQGTWETLGDRGVKYTSHGLSRLGSPILVERVWFWKNDTQLALEERIASAGRFRFNSYLHWGDAPWQAGPDGKSFFCSVFGKQVRMQVFPPKGTKISVIQSKYSPEYGVEREGRTLCITGRLNLPIEWKVEWDFEP